MIDQFYTYPTLHIFTAGIWKIERMPTGEFHFAIDESREEIEKLALKILNISQEEYDKIKEPWL